MKFLSAILAVLATSTAMADMNGVKVIYGEDNRNDVVDYRNRKMVEASQSTVALIKAADLTASGSQWTIDADTSYGDKMGLCSSERFYKQPAAAFCSGFLVAPNKIMTAGHCVTSHSACEDVRFLFDYKMINKDRAQSVFSESQVYSCKKVIGWKKDNTGADFAVIELDREVKDRKPLKLSDNKGLKLKTDLTVIGYPSGLPAKITDGANVRSILAGSGYLVANLDTYGGNSGSAVLNSKTLEVEGILVRGETDFISSGGCRISNRVSDTSGRGEDVTLISVVEENGGFSTTPAPTTPTTPVTGMRYVWLSDNTCNEFYGNLYIREVADSFCPDAPANAQSRYVWLSDNTCNEFRGNHFIREVADALCGAAATANQRYVWLSDQTCNLFNGNSFIREVADSLCGH